MKLIVSIQELSTYSTKELAKKALSNGASYIRTDRDIKSKGKTLGLVKNKEYEFYITPTIQDIEEVSKWAKYVCIDCRKENPNLKELLKYCNDNDIKFVADVEKIEDVVFVLNYTPQFISTTFCYNKTDKLNIIKQIKERVNKIPPIIAEGGYSLTKKYELDFLKELDIDFLCVGKDIAKVDLLTDDFYKYINEPIIERKEIIAVDIDDTIFKYNNIIDRRTYNNPIPVWEEIFRINVLRKKYLIFYYTGRNWGLFDFTRKQLNEFGVEYDNLICGKIPFSNYIDSDNLKSSTEIL